MTLSASTAPTAFYNVGQLGVGTRCVQEHYDRLTDCLIIDKMQPLGFIWMIAGILIFARLKTDGVLIRALHVSAVCMPFAHYTPKPGNLKITSQNPRYIIIHINISPLGSLDPRHQHLAPKPLNLEPP